MKHTINTTSTAVEVLPIVDIDKIVKSKIAISGERQNFDDPFFVCDLGDIVAKHQRWLKEFPRIHPHYAIKCNPDETMLKLMLSMGTGFDCASKAEIRTMLELGAKPEQIVFANPCKQKSHIVYAKENNVNLIVFDNEHELIKMKKTFPDAKLLLRIQTDDSASVCRFSMKYGAHPDSCPKLIETAFKMGLTVVGISFHVGSGCQDTTAFVEALQNSRKLFDYADSIGFHFNVLDIGGGFPGTNDVELKFEEITSVVNNCLDELFPVDKFGHVNIIAEPGRYYAASAFTLTTNVIAKKDVAGKLPAEEDSTGAVLNAAMPRDDQEPGFMYYLNDGLYGSFNCLYYDHAKVIPSLLVDSFCDEKFSSSLWGPTCDGLDQIMEFVRLPELHVGDWIVWKDMGAYTVAAGSSFNGFKTREVYYCISKAQSSALQKMKSVFPKMQRDFWNPTSSMMLGDPHCVAERCLERKKGKIDLKDKKNDCVACQIPVAV